MIITKNNIAVGYSHEISFLRTTISVDHSMHVENAFLKQQLLIRGNAYIYDLHPI